MCMLKVRDVWVWIPVVSYFLLVWKILFEIVLDKEVTALLSYGAYSKPCHHDPLCGICTCMAKSEPLYLVEIDCEGGWIENIMYCRMKLVN